MNEETGSNVFLTGLPNLGKTTAIKKVVESLGSKRVAGFYTEAIRNGRERLGFRLISFDGQRETLAHVRLRSPFRVGRYKVAVRRFEKMILEIFENSAKADLFIVDEIGKMECYSEHFRNLMDLLYDDPRPLIATLASRGSAYIENLHNWPRGPILELTAENRESMPGKLLSWLQDRETKEAPAEITEPESVTPEPAKPEPSSPQPADSELEKKSL